MEDGHHEVLTISENASQLILLYFQESEPDHVVRAFSLRVKETGEQTWYVGVAEAVRNMEDIDERIIDPLIKEGKYRDHWLPLRRTMVNFMQQYLPNRSRRADAQEPRE